MKFDFLSPTFIRFGNGVLETVGQEACKIGRNALLVTGKSSAKKSGSLKKVEELLKRENLEIALFDQVEQNPSVETVEAGAGVARKAGCDLIVALGGGSPLDAAKGIAVLAAQRGSLDDYFGVDKIKQALPLMAIPTTAGTGSEVTRYAIITDWKIKQKRTVASSLLCPRTAIVDPLLTVPMPKQITANTGMDALS
ncbi:MAG: iron-containing alcohol dehydrogenase, partial [Candidatus Latescibacteria bacterium]|nr:iron-containing alcohol dehydrogenase [Candidatus Latescibacterota bacterium]